MKCVVDRNYLQSPDLEVFLRDDAAHRVVLIDFAGIEGYSGNPLKNAPRSLEILKRFPDQVMVSKSTRDVIQLGNILPHMRFNMVDWGQTRHFPSFCHAVSQAADGNSRVAEELRELASHAQAHLDFMRDQMPGIVDYIEHFKGIAGIDVMKARRHGAPMPGDAGLRLLDAMHDLALRLFENNQAVPSVPDTVADARHYFLFRYAVATTLLILRWATDGGAVQAKPEVLRNDVVDLSYVTHATYWDGLLTKDAKMQDIYDETMVLIENVFSPQSSMPV